MTSVRDASSDIPSTVLRRAGVFPDAAAGCFPTAKLTELARTNRAVLAPVGVDIVRIFGERGAVRSSYRAADGRLDRAPRTPPEVGTVLPAIHRRRVRGSKPVLGVEHDQ